MIRIGLMIILFWANSALAGDAIYTKWSNNNAVSGYDTVAYFTKGKPVKGSKKYSMTYKGAKWLFSTADHLATFKQNPEKYAPQFGGFCAWAVAAKNDRASGDPLRWNIIDGKLYLNYDKEIQNKWQADIPGFIKTANKNWPSLLNN